MKFLERLWLIIDRYLTYVHVAISHILIHNSGFS